MEKNLKVKRIRPRGSFGEMLCPVCSKIFICYNASVWAYKKELLGKKYTFCSYKCQQKKVKEIETQKALRVWKRGMKKYE
jgi:YHS domain-containing protein